MLCGIGVMLFSNPIKKSIYFFLCINKPVQADVLVIESWLSNCMLKEAATEFSHGGYRYCLVTGKKNKAIRSPVDALVRFGIDSNKVKSAEAKMHKGYNTFYMAQAAQEWLIVNDPTVSRINVFTAGPHGRKSWIINKRVFGKKYNIGILCASVEKCNSQMWWQSKRGTFFLVKYGLGCIYAQFWPFRT
jgi:hypothetical protein